jgi:hypothetical protein
VVPPIDQLRRTGKQLLENLNQTDRDHGRLFFQKLTAEHLRRLAVIDPEGMAADEASLMCLTLDERVGVALGIVVGFASTTTTPSPDDALSLLLREVANEIDGSGALEQDVVRLWQSATPNDYGTPRSSFLRLKDPKSFDDVLPQLHSDLVGRLSETKLDLLMQNLRATTGLGFSFKQRPDYIKQLRHRTYGSRHVSREESASSPWTRNTKFRQEAVKLVDEIHVEMLAAGNRTGLLDLAVQMFDVVPEAVDGALIHAFREGDMNLLRELAVVTAQPYDATSLDRTIAIAFSLGGHQSVFDILDQLPNGLRGVSRTQWPFGPDLRADVAQFDLWSELPQQLSTGVRNSCLAWQQFHAPPRLFERLDNSIGL